MLVAGMPQWIVGSPIIGRWEGRGAVLLRHRTAFEGYVEDKPRCKIQNEKSKFEDITIQNFKIRSFGYN